MKIITIIIMTMFVMSMISPMVLAEEVKEDVVEESGISPDSYLYGLDRAMERVKLAITFNKEKKAEYALKNANERLFEVRDMINSNKMDKANLAEKYYQKSVEYSENAMNSIDTNGNAENAKLALEKHLRMQNRLLAHKEKVSAVKAGILERQGERMTEEQVAHMDEVFGKIQQRMKTAEENAVQRQENIRTRYKVLSGMTDSEIDGSMNLGESGNKPSESTQTGQNSEEK